MQRALILAAFLSAPITARTPASAPDGADSAPAVVPAAATVAKEKGEQVVIRTNDDLELGGSYFEPRRRGTQRAPAVILLHDAGHERKQMTELAERLQKIGFAALTVDLRGHGESRADGIDWSLMDEDARSATWALAIRDIEASARWVLKQDGVHSTNLNLVGFGAGCALTVRHATRDENVRSVVLLELKSNEYGFNVEADLSDLQGLPTMVLAGRNDQSEAERMVQTANQISHPFIELMLCSSKTPSLIEDKRTQSKVVSWLKDEAMPKKSSR